MAANNRLIFSKKRIEALPIPTNGRAEYRDIKTPGLTLRVTSGGVKSFSLFRRVNGQPARVTIGSYPAVTCEQAQQRARELLNQITKGADPRVDKRAARNEPTVADLFAHWTVHAKARKKSWAEDVRMYEKHLSHWGKRKLSSIRTSEVQSLHFQLAKKSGKYQANRVVELLRAAFNKSRDIGYDGNNPTLGIKRFTEEKRDRFLHGDELKAFFTALAGEPNDTLRDYFLFCLLTGVRKSNALAARWEQIDLATGLWRIPGESAKAGVAIVVPLVGPVIRLLQNRLQAANGSPSPWVFASNRGTAGHIVEPKSAWKRIIERAGLTDVRPHDLRRSLGSWMALQGTGLPIIGKMLGHTQQSTTQIYARLTVDPVREAAEKATAAMLEYAGGVLTLDVETKGGNDEK